jgi:hypothetical protein
VHYAAKGITVKSIDATLPPKQPKIIIPKKKKKKKKEG